MKPWIKLALCGVAVGLLNGFFGSGGGVAAVLILKKIFDIDAKQAHASALLVIAPLCVVSLFFYWSRIPLLSSLWVSLGGVVGGIIGAVLLKKISPVWLTRLFGGMMLLGGLKLLFR